MFIRVVAACKQLGNLNMGLIVPPLPPSLIIHVLDVYKNWKKKQKNP
jgi:hypothetical protein